MEIENFEAGIFMGEDTLLLGSGAGKNASFAKLLSDWHSLYPEKPLVIFDYAGKFYERCCGPSLLVDLSSRGSLIPDLIEPFVFSEDIGARSADIAYALRRAIYREIKSRDANDKFFDDLGKLLTDRMLVYMLETEKNILKNLSLASEDKDITTVSRMNSLFTIFCRQHRYIEGLMTKVTAGESNALPNSYRLAEAEAAGLFLSRSFALAKYILKHELRYQKDQETPVPFADLLYTTSENTNTQRCIKMQADASTSDFRALVALMASNSKIYTELETLKLNSWLQAPKGRPLFVCSSGSGQADRGLATLLISALGAAAGALKTEVMIVIPELERWGLADSLDNFRQDWERLRFAFGYGNFSRLALDSRSGDDQLIETLYSASTQRVWHMTEEERLTKAFASYVSEADVIYRPQDLNSDIRAVEKEGSVRYAAMNTVLPAPAVRRRERLRRAEGSARLWITKGAERPEKLTIESLLEEGETL